MTLLITPHVVHGASGYCLTSSIVSAWSRGEVSRMWAIGPRIVSGQLEKRLGGGVWKSWDRFQDVCPELLAECATYNVKHPSSYSSIYHQLASTPRLSATYNNMLRWWPGGPWEEALFPGIHTQKWYRYDMRSAYRWAATCGLPDIETVQASCVRDASEHDGIFVMYIHPRIDLPYCFRRGGTVLMTGEEVRTFHLSRSHYQVLRGLTWTRTMPSDYVESKIAQFSFAKSIGRAYWGRWISKDPLRTVTKARTWDTPNHKLNFLWGLVIVARVRLRVWLAAMAAAHVFVDEVLVPHEIETGDGLGDWHLKEVYPTGIVVKRTGHYGPLGGESVMQTGSPRTREERQEHGINRNPIPIC